MARTRAADLPAEGSAEEAILALLYALTGEWDGTSGDRGLMPLLVHGSQHISTCSHGQWISPDGPRPHGDPCIERCLRAQEAARLGIRWVYAHRQPEQPSLFGDQQAGPEAVAG